MNRNRSIVTERLYLREMVAEDFEALYAILADSDIMQHYPYTFDAARVRGWIEKNTDRYRTLGFGLWAVCLRDSDEMIGDCGLTIQNINGRLLPEIGYHFRRDRQGKGYAKEAAAAVRDWTFCCTPFLEVFSYMKSTNMPSAACARSWGCRQVSEFTDETNGVTTVFSLTKDDWRTLPKQDNGRHVQWVRRIDDRLRLVPYYPAYSVTLPWYLDKDVCRQTDNREELYDIARLKQMYDYLRSTGYCYYIEHCGQLVGDVTLRDNKEICIVIRKEDQNRHIGRRCIREMILLSSEIGLDTVTANIYGFNAQSQHAFLAAGFVKTGAEQYTYRVNV